MKFNSFVLFSFSPGPKEREQMPYAEKDMFENLEIRVRYLSKCRQPQLDNDAEEESVGSVADSFLLERSQRRTEELKKKAGENVLKVEDDGDVQFVGEVIKGPIMH
jgi:hypothetical protein